MLYISYRDMVSPMGCMLLYVRGIYYTITKIVYDRI